VLLVDEPTSALDHQRAIDIVTLLRDETRRHQIATLMVTHDQSVARLADRVIEMRDGRRRRWTAMPFIALGVAMIIVATIVNVAVPVIIRDLHVSEAGAEWLNSVYSLVFAAPLITFGHAGDRWGRRRMFSLGTAVFVVASVVSATAVNGGMLIAGRALQGVGGAMILPATLATVNVLFTGRKRAVAFAIWGSTIGAFGALGPLLGGLLTTDVSWRWAFLVNLFIGAIVIGGIL
jgi:MFS family permease